MVLSPLTGEDRGEGAYFLHPHLYPLLTPLQIDIEEFMFM